MYQKGRGRATDSPYGKDNCKDRRNKPFCTVLPRGRSITRWTSQRKGRQLPVARTLSGSRTSRDGSGRERWLRGSLPCPLPASGGILAT